MWAPLVIQKLKNVIYSLIGDVLMKVYFFFLLRKINIQCNFTEGVKTFACLIKFSYLSRC